MIAIGTAKINSYLAAILMSTTPLSGSILAHIFTKDEKLSFSKSLGVLVGFSGIILLFFDKVIINADNYLYALVTILGSTFYCIGGLLTLKLKNKKNEKCYYLNYFMVCNFFVTFFTYYLKRHLVLLPP